MSASPSLSPYSYCSYFFVRQIWIIGRNWNHRASCRLSIITKSSAVSCFPKTATPVPIATTSISITSSSCYSQGGHPEALLSLELLVWDQTPTTLKEGELNCSSAAPGGRPCVPTPRPPRKARPPFDADAGRPGSGKRRRCRDRTD